MGLSFVNPFLLFALAAGVLPILIHRLTRRKAFAKKFSAVRLLLQSQQNMARPQRLKHFLLLALRVLAVVTLVFLFARPLLNQQGILPLNEGGPTVMVLDNSGSMGYRDERGERFEVAKKAAKEILLRLSGPVLVIPTAGGSADPQATQEFRWMRRDEALKKVDEIALCPSRGNPSEALKIAFRSLREVKEPGSILLLTDLTRGDWEDLDLSKTERISVETGIVLLRFGGPRRDPNLAVKEVGMAEGEAVAGVSCRLEATLANRSDSPVSTTVSLFVGALKADQKKADLKAGEEAKISFDLLPEKPGWLDGEVRLTGDAMALDDSYFFAMHVKDKVKVLIVDGDPRRALKSSESYYLVHALSSGREEETPFLPQVVTEGEFSRMDTHSYDALFLLNVARPQGSRIASFLDRGKPVLIFLGDQVNPAEYHAIPLFPWRLREIHDGERQKPQRISQIDFQHAALKNYSGGSEGSLKGAVFRRYLRTEGSTRTLLRFENGDPLLVQADVEKGRLYLFASSADLDWNDLPLKAGYLPLIQGLLKEATGLRKNSWPQSAPYERTPPGRNSSMQVRGTPGGLGIYRISEESEELWRGVNLPPEESNLGKVTDGEVEKKFGSLQARVTEYSEGVGKKLNGGRRELWPLLLGFLIVILGLEMGVAGRI